MVVIEKSSGLTEARIRELAELLAAAKSAVFIWSMGLTQHRFGTDNISQVANLAMLRGFIGREFCGVMPIRGHSGVQGSGEMGADPFSMPGGEFKPEDIRRVEQVWNFPIPDWQGDIVGVTLENAMLPEDHERKLKLFYTSGGNFIETMPEPEFVRQCLENIELRVHQDIILNTSTLVDAAETVIVLPAMTRYEQPGGGTSTSTERMVYFSPEIQGSTYRGSTGGMANLLRFSSTGYIPERKAQIHFNNAQEIRDEIARAVPMYDGIQHLKQKGDVFQYGGAWLCEDGVCPTKDGKGTLIPIELPERRKPEGHFYITTRRGKQFNSMIYSDKDPFNAAGRYAVLMNAEDAKKPPD